MDFDLNSAVRQDLARRLGEFSDIIIRLDSSKPCPRELGEKFNDALRQAQAISPDNPTVKNTEPATLVPAEETIGTLAAKAQLLSDALSPK